jgi:hypothetical protein
MPKAPAWPLASVFIVLAVHPASGHDITEPSVSFAALVP